MTPLQARRAQLDAEFETSRTMTPDVYNARVEELHDQERKRKVTEALETKATMRTHTRVAMAASPAPLTGDDRFVSFSALKEILSQITVELRKKFEAGASALAALQTRMCAIETRIEQLPDSESNIAALQQRTYRLEVQIGALAMMNGSREGLAEIAQLRAEIKALEARPVMSYRGVWSADADYVEGNFCTHAGSLWACLELTRAKPGSGTGWQLCAKKGADGKDAR